MHYQTYQPCPALSRHIRCYWTLDMAAAPGPVSRERVFPDGCVELIFHYGDLFKKYARDDESGFQPRSFLHGQLREFMDIEASGQIGIFSVRFEPNGLWPFLNVGVHEIGAQAVAVRDIWGQAGDVIEDKILNARSNPERIQLLEQFLSGKLKGLKHDDQLITQCIHTIVQKAGNVPVDELADTVLIGRRHLERRFIHSVGMNPKLFARIIRFQQTLRLSGQKQFTSLTQLALESGFYDQAHFIKDFKTFAGINPKAYFAEHFELAKHLVSG